MFYSLKQLSLFNSGVDKQDYAVEIVIDRIREKSIDMSSRTVMKFDLLSSSPT